MYACSFRKINTHLPSSPPKSIKECKWNVGVPFAHAATFNLSFLKYIEEKWYEENSIKNHVSYMEASHADVCMGIYVILRNTSELFKKNDSVSRTVIINALKWSYLINSADQLINTACTLPFIVLDYFAKMQAKSILIYRTNIIYTYNLIFIEILHLLLLCYDFIYYFIR